MFEKTELQVLFIELKYSLMWMNVAHAIIFGSIVILKWKVLKLHWENKQVNSEGEKKI